MNPTAPVWVSNGGAAAAASVHQQQQRSTLDPNTAEFHPRSAPVAKQPPSQPSTFTKYVGNPVVHQLPGAGGAAGHHGAYGGGAPSHLGFGPSHQQHAPSHHTGPRGGAAGYPVNRHTSGGGGGFNNSGGAAVPPGGSGRHHQPSNGPYAAYGSAHHYPLQNPPHAAGGPQQGHPLASRGHLNHHQGSAAGGPQNAQQYSAKAGTHWGSAGGPPSNMQQTHHTTNGAVLYNQQQVANRNHHRSQQHSHVHPSPFSSPSHQPTSHASEYAAPSMQHLGSNLLPQLQSSSSKGGSTTPQNSKSVGLHDDVLFTPSTRGIWSGAAADSAPGADDEAYGSLLDHVPRSSNDIDSGLVDRHDAPAVSAVVNSLLMDSLTKGCPADDDAHDAWVQSPPSLNIAGADLESTPWARLLTPPPASLSASVTDAQSGADHVDTVQHLLAQLTKSSSDAPFDHAGGAQKLTSSPKVLQMNHTTSQHQHIDPTIGGTSKRGTPQLPHQPALAMPPSAIGGSPTSPEMRGVAAAASAAAQIEAVSKTLTVHGDDTPLPVVMKAVPRSMQQQQQPSTPPPMATTTLKVATAGAHRAGPSAAATLDDKKIPTAAPTPTKHEQGVAIAAPAPLSSVAAIAATATTSNPSDDPRKWKVRADVTQLLVAAKETMRHIKILSFSKKYPEEIAKLFQGWAAKGIPAPDDVFGAYYLYVVKKSGVELCMKHNGRGRAPGVGYGRCDFANRGPNYKCRFHHMCLFCKGEDHGWFDESKCARFQEFRRELTKVGITDADIEPLVEAYDNTPSA